ncbi:uncharacterized protein [Watersipora subatra]|uniref:uncharacterized protein isoform X2 n=1 Tax=Watersipora subatra TaxID=2589382 RepID=UPI00355B9CAF
MEDLEDEVQTETGVKRAKHETTDPDPEISCLRPCLLQIIKELDDEEILIRNARNIVITALQQGMAENKGEQENDSLQILLKRTLYQTESRPSVDFQATMILKDALSALVAEPPTPAGNHFSSATLTKCAKFKCAFGFI